MMHIYQMEQPPRKLRRQTKPTVDPVVDYEQRRMDVWIQVCTAVCGAWNCKEPSAGVRWADAVLEAFDQRFKK